LEAIREKHLYIIIPRLPISFLPQYYNYAALSIRHCSNRCTHGKEKAVPNGEALFRHDAAGELLVLTSLT
jgi:hypothetical protein